VDDTDKIVAAIFAASFCAKLSKPQHVDYIIRYREFLKLLSERDKEVSASNLEAIIKMGEG